FNRISSSCLCRLCSHCVRKFKFEYRFVHICPCTFDIDHAVHICQRSRKSKWQLGKGRRNLQRAESFYVNRLIYWEIPKRLGDLVKYKRKGEKKMKKKLSFLSVVFSAGMLLAACGGDDSSSSEEGSSTEGGSSDLNLLEEGKFTTASSGLYKPFSFEEGGNLDGFDIDIGNAIAEEMGLEPNPITTPFETIIQGLNTNR